MYMDEFTFAKAPITGLFTPSVLKTVETYYSNGEIHITGYNGRVRVYDLAGKAVVDGLAIDGKIKVSVNRGIYIVNTAIGNSKVSVQ
jgi:hypothetical protein